MLNSGSFHRGLLVATLPVNDTQCYSFVKVDSTGFISKLEVLDYTFLENSASEEYALIVMHCYIALRRQFQIRRFHHDIDTGCSPNI